MNKIVLNKKQYFYLKNFLFEKDDSLNKKIQVEEVSNNFILVVDDDIACDIGEWAMTELLRIGFDIHYELTEEGRILQEIVNDFNI